MNDFPFSAINFDDVDLFSEWEVGLGWDVESTQLSHGAFRLDFDHVATPELLVAHFRTKGTMHNVFTVPEGMVVLVICRARLPLVWCGREFSPSLMGVCRSSHGEQWSVIPDGWDCYEFMMAEALIRRTGILPTAFFARTTRLEDAYLPLVEPATGQFLKQMDRFFLRFKQTNGRPDDAVRKAVFLDFVVDGLQRVFDAGLAARGLLPRATRRADLFMNAKELMRTRLATDVTTHELAQSLDVSYRVLNYAFQEAIGLSPYQYFLTEKLHAARRTLKSSNARVLDTCAHYGFSTPSRFSRYYQRLFGELPSETKKQSKSLRVNCS